ncbi:hypothetical protein HAX54_045847, partial [Datura stramonium]|nr:hypothetical protein [Datura stramonium]
DGISAVDRPFMMAGGSSSSKEENCWVHHNEALISIADPLQQKIDHYNRRCEA